MSLHAPGPAGAAPPSLPVCPASRTAIRVALALLTVTATAAAAWAFAGTLPNSPGWLRWPLVGLFAVLFGWIALSFWTATIGFVSVLLRPTPATIPTLPDDFDPNSLPPTAVLVPVYNEDPTRVCAGVRAMLDSLRAVCPEAGGASKRFDFFLLSDSTDADVWLAEERAWAELTDSLPEGERVFYRHRPENTARKAGNVADFVERWGEHYEFMVTLDADSLMAGPTLVEMTRRIAADESCGILQAPPTPVGRTSVLARWQQFAARLYSPVFLRGFSLWAGTDGNYWGHNAILRVEPFRACCDLPVLPGVAPLGGEILSHDFIEAALMRRAGWGVRLAEDLGGSYEECPTTLLDWAKRDQRWCQGNLQHGRVLWETGARMPFQRSTDGGGLAGVSKLHLAMGVMGYCASPLWLAFLVLTLLAAAVGGEAIGEPGGVFPRTGLDPAAIGLGLFGLCMAMLILPKLYSLLAAARSGSLDSFGGGVRATVGVVCETLLSALVAPIMMLFHSRFVLTTLAGRVVKWGAQSRGEQTVTWFQAVRDHWPAAAIGVLAGVAAGLAAPDSLPWLAPVALGLILAGPTAVLLASRSAGLSAQQWGLWWTPEELDPPRVLRRHVELLATPAVVEETETPDEPLFGRVLRDPAFFALHSELLAATDADRPLPPDARDRIEAAVGETDGKGWERLTPADRRAVLGDRRTLAELHARTRVNVTAA
ncbi:glucans biosynthesis glucosyltransferase MdoH [Alienimonas chondri]|uniref:Glucans biosynthesis glucosyltransferase H n=1 Tax=Alienimonas chondri TaxID=2681879 RepID=A0ABX1VFD2_9PLAN|nr:glucans biosynthesis glucosyltransferase MdoH [Alienimonas chondri]NNJ26696.1 Glucans biosynthesis glucosyltransferase H [Alienimonas chondri]